MWVFEICLLLMLLQMLCNEFVRGVSGGLAGDLWAESGPVFSSLPALGRNLWRLRTRSPVSQRRWRIPEETPADAWDQSEAPQPHLHPDAG